ncbi:hypothetical protein TVNIR_0114 [Thioalkalivibrio nitratireducens DSM 14787]|uniref:Uncharacterized protein n=1 Tax=Thioalkalivibrio nitratireducens (strain DSM 14787 / UNIQEM 213 / ALEN2) TaxID=1255043 RepID=L0DTY5_THIND|nr:hypothetical protein TVNIR_0114 [Thioalkalivibrio nitratireducens DSM 14787]
MVRHRRIPISRSSWTTGPSLKSSLTVTRTSRSRTTLSLLSRWQMRWPAKVNGRISSSMAAISITPSNMTGMAIRSPRKPNQILVMKVGPKLEIPGRSEGKMFK